mmetsp:Transcript_21217/g.68460  ORF Transcript_21217/g.68460 Transcript_21217/m.68460 type:complete len:220 (+) Transcript_21217:959-1618(+)
MPYDGVMRRITAGHFVKRTKKAAATAAGKTTKRKKKQQKALVYDERWWRQENYSSFEYVLNLPGKTSGSYSRNLNHLWALGSVVLLWDSPVVEFYYPALRAGETHVAVDYDTAVAEVEALARDPARRKKLAEAAVRVHEEFLCPRCIAREMLAVFEDLRTYFRLADVLDDPRRTRDLFTRHLNCSSPHYLEVDATTTFRDGAFHPDVAKKPADACPFFF